MDPTAAERGRGGSGDAAAPAAHDALRDRLRAEHPDLARTPWGWSASKGGSEVQAATLEELAAKLSEPG
jgi:hypothetical protein